MIKYRPFDTDSAAIFAKACFGHPSPSKRQKLREGCAFLMVKLNRKEAFMDNDTLINQARHLYVALHVEQHALSAENKIKFDRLDPMVIQAYCRYQRRLNRCVLCYQFRNNDCFREFFGNKRQFCPALRLVHKP